MRDGTITFRLVFIELTFYMKGVSTGTKRRRRRKEVKVFVM